MRSAEQFIEYCEEIVADYGAGKLSLHDAASKINTNPVSYPFEGPTHPMVRKVADLAFDIAEDYRSEKEDKADWNLLTKTLKDYTHGNWEPTCWILNATYGKYDGKKLSHSYSIAIRRQNGDTIIETADNELKARVNRLIKKLNFQQTDERYLHNLKILMPHEVGQFKLADVEVREYLTEPYYTTAG